MNKDTTNTPPIENQFSRDDEGLNDFLFWVDDMGPASLRRVATGIECACIQAEQLAIAKHLRGRADRLEAAGVTKGALQ